MHLVDFKADRWKIGDYFVEASEAPHVQLLAPSGPAARVETQLLRDHIRRYLRLFLNGVQPVVNEGTFGYILHDWLEYAGGGLFLFGRPNEAAGCGPIHIGVSADLDSGGKTSDCSEWLLCVAWTINGVAATDNVGGGDGPEDLVQVLCGEMAQWASYAAQSDDSTGGR